MIAEKERPPFSVKMAQRGRECAQAATFSGLFLITTIVAQYLLQYPINYLFIPIIPFFILTVVAFLTTITALLTAALTGHLTETWEEFIK